MTSLNRRPPAQMTSLNRRPPAAQRAIASTLYAVGVLGVVLAVVALLVIGEGFGGLLLLAITAFLVYCGVFCLATRLKYAKTWCQAGSILAVLWLVAWHAWAANLLRPTLAEFRRVAKTASHTEYVVTDDDEVTVCLDYRGKLTEVVQQRDTVLRKHGFTMLGFWKAFRNGSHVETTSTGVYIYIGPFASRRSS